MFLFPRLGFWARIILRMPFLHSPKLERSAIVRSRVLVVHPVDGSGKVGVAAAPVQLEKEAFLLIRSMRTIGTTASGLHEEEEGLFFLFCFLCLRHVSEVSLAAREGLKIVS